LVFSILFSIYVLRIVDFSGALVLRPIQQFFQILDWLGEFLNL
jgi:hypothetical protein